MGRRKLSAWPGASRQLNGLKHGLLLLILTILTIPVVAVLWFMLTGVLMPLDELKVTLAPALSGSATAAVTTASASQSGAAAVSDLATGYAIWPLLPSWPTLQPLTELLLDTPAFFVMFWNSFKIVLPALLGQFLFGAPAAWALSRFRFPGRKLLLGIYIVLMLMPFQVTMVPNYLVARQLGIVDTIWAVALPFAFSAYPVFIMSKSFDAVPHAMLEAASIDGAGYWQTFVRVGLPLGVPGIVSALVLGFLECWNAIEQPLVFLKDSRNWPLSLFLPQITASRLGLAMSASLIMLAPAVLIFFFGQKYLELGIQATGVKE
ncbi:carbohydrate ABC transporter permease [Oscillospiraceae bacterium HV4-5-C5C]|nr:carbohydrate ABC transporter permease [Oscillospiraceae bacterium HV4-5-C5C]